MKNIILVLVTLLIITLAACGTNNQDKAGKSKSGSEAEESQQGHTGHEAAGENDSHEGMEHAGSGEEPEGMIEAASPKYEVGSNVIIDNEHMPGMKGAEATIVGAYDTTVYRVSYDPVTGGDRVEKHEWVVHEELKDAGDEPFKPGEEVTIIAEHMEGMKGAAAIIDTAEQTTVYVVDYTPQNGSEIVKNHLWVTEDELSLEE
ncbi:DUF1541 domain-containing protein [Bacillus salacetis]|uniref:YdhK family protein n=1 Tax=Bacillus salacetis TaxID=2315464 RepID=UPI003BA20509